ncbi:sialate O-acetylesterase [Rhodococcus ruber]
MARKLVSFDEATGKLSPDVETALGNGFATKGEVGSKLDQTAVDARVRAVGDATYAPVDGVLPTETAESPNNYIFGALDATGRVAENVIDEEGQVPAWVLDRWKSRMGLGGAGSQTTRVHLVVAAGQSNSTISGGATPPTGLYDTDPRLLKWNRETSSIVPMPASEAFLLPSFAREYIKSAPSDVQVLVVPCGYGETGFTTTSLASPPAGYRTVANGTWDRTLTSDPKNLYSMMVADVVAARDAAAPLSSTAPTVAALLWSQGESDVTYLDQTQYATKLDDLITQFRTDTGLPNLPVLVGSMTPEYVANTAGAGAIQAALGDTPRRLQKTAYVYGPAGLPRTDQANYIHWSVPGQAERGRLFCEALPRAHWNYSGIYAVPPQNLRAVRSGTTLTATWDPSPVRATAYTVEVSSDSGATWAPLTITGGAIGLTGTATVPATGALQLRASATNETNTSSYVTATI